MGLWEFLGGASVVIAIGTFVIARRRADSAWWRAIVPGAAIGLAYLGVLGVLIGYEGASRAFSVGLHTLFRDHPIAFAITTAVGVALAVFAGRRLASMGEIRALLAGVVATDLLSAALLDIVIGEIVLALLPLELWTLTIGGSQLLAVAVGAVMGRMTRRGASAAGSRAIS